jgi:hypothetical protein
VSENCTLFGFPHIQLQQLSELYFVQISPRGLLGITAYPERQLLRNGHVPVAEGAGVRLIALPLNTVIRRLQKGECSQVGLVGFASLITC